MSNEKEKIVNVGTQGHCGHGGSKSTVECVVKPFAVGDTVVTTTGIWDSGADYSPPCWLAQKGESLIVRRLYGKSIGVSHHNITANHFIVEPHEIRQAEPLS